MLGVRRLTIETEETLYKVGFVSALAVVIALTLWWTVYRDGGVAYYAKVHEPRSQFSVTVPVNLRQKCYVYRALAKDAAGRGKLLEFKTDEYDPGPFSDGQILRLTYNTRYGVTHYERVSINEVPLKARD
ncbi:YxeA family protein [Lacticaseibacillus rhamnosus]|nr:YxeA family protein [Lacticaseibacillus rhamnosus]OFJ98220.1 hypothetical protein HMPREF2838_05145 [Lactobacillus sp. HMSC066G01]OFP84493.1 hypothetical protein HMPREF2969_07130 [Lactobacillus sp. HMSC056D05]OFR80195.1 hypothetical protein HMPREF2869_13505 [Lactobacillus sp. HMSC061B07]AMQ04008.1 hypothetical protein A0F16_11340 [Lacticaseibacillus rhamnosus]KDS82674.1 hypothetical protein LR51B_06795 [Lacticaseibacillus rhamnosus 51B]